MIISLLDDLSRLRGPVRIENVNPIPVCLSIADLRDVGKFIGQACTNLKHVASMDGPPEASFLADALRSFQDLIGATDPRKRGSLILDVRYHVRRAQALFSDNIKEATQLGVESFLKARVPQSPVLMGKLKIIAKELCEAQRAIYLANVPGMRDSGLRKVEKSLRMAVITGLEVLATSLRNPRG